MSDVAAHHFGVGPGPIQLGADAIAARVAALGERITSDYRDRPPHVVCVLNGAFLFMADLVRAIRLPITVDFIAVSSYGEGTTTSGTVRLTRELTRPLAGRDVIVVDDIIDTGLTMRFLLDHLRERGARSLRIAALLSKPARRAVDVDIDYLGFEIEDAFVYGYGLDVDQRYRNLPYVTSVGGEAGV
jgi:hypoxanthine phosphoribosyltransferase